MSLVDLAAARAHLRVNGDYPEAQITPYLAAAEGAAQQFMNRRVYATPDALAAALAAVPAALATATTARADALVAADVLTDPAERCAALAAADRVYRAALTRARETRAGIVDEDGDIEAAILLIMGHLFSNRDTADADLPNSARALLQPHRVDIGV